MPSDNPPRVASGAVLARSSGFFLFWLIIAEFKTADFVVGVLAALLAAWISLLLMPTGTWRFRPIKLTTYALRFLRQSVTAGIDVAWRALDPRMPLQPGFVTYQTQMPAGATREAFCTISSLLPGTLPSGRSATGGIAVHCLDVSQPVVDQMAAEEALFVDALGERPRHG